MGRSEGDFRHLLDTNADQNIGNSAILQPQAGYGGTTIPQTNPQRLLQLTGPSKTGQTTSVVFTASRIVGADNPHPGLPGPITGVVEFGNGARFTRAEFDVPIGPYLGWQGHPLASSEPQDGGTIVTVPTGVLRAYVRYDNLLIQPLLGLPTTNLADELHVPLVGPGGPNSLLNAPAEPVLTKAMAAFYTRHYSKLYKTNYLYVGDHGVPPQFIPTGTLVCVPPFARSVKVFRLKSSNMPSMTISLWDGAHIAERFVIPADTSPSIDISGNESVIEIASTANTDTVTFLALCYEIGL
jgi:hypothetical protein